MVNPKANIKLRKGAVPATVSNYSRDSSGLKLAFPTQERQENGWNSKTPKQILNAYPDRYEPVTNGKTKEEVN